MGQNVSASKRNRKLQRVITIIIVTDFLCWVPFIVVSVLHNLKVIDATDWYVYFAMTVLPLNSVLNPMIYEESIRKLFLRKARDFREFIRSLGRFNLMVRAQHDQNPALGGAAEIIESEVIEP